jgi:hypothetical protein
VVKGIVRNGYVGRLVLEESDVLCSNSVWRRGSWRDHALAAPLPCTDTEWLRTHKPLAVLRVSEHASSDRVRSA